MTRQHIRPSAAVTALWRADRPLTLTGLAMLGALAAFGVGIMLDPRLITGAPAWLKPAKFAASIAIYTLTLAWVFMSLREWPKLRRVVGWTTAVAFWLEIAIIALQAARGTTSHFNIATPLDAVFFAAMGGGILVQTAAAVAVAVALWRQPFADRALGWGLRLGLTLSLVGASVGSLMTRPTAAQLAEARQSGRRITIAGAHTVGALDGGAGVPGTGWSVEHGDLRVPHFVGLHAFQALPIVALLARRRGWPLPTRVRVTLVAAASYTALFMLLLWQALRGQAVVQPDTVTLAVFAMWAVTTAVAVGVAIYRWQPRPVVLA